MPGRMTICAAAAMAAAVLLSSCDQGRELPPSPARRASGTGTLGGYGGVHLREREHPKVPGEVEAAWAEPADAAAAGAASEAVIGPPPIDKPDPYRVRSGDVLIIDVLGEDDMRQTVPVGPDGRINYYIAHGVEAAGRTFAEIRAAIARRLRAHFRNPQVSVSGKSYSGNTVSVLGVVGKPGRYEIRSDTRLLDAIAEAGGIPISWLMGRSSVGAVDVADLEHAYLLRDGRFVDVDFVSVFRGTEGEVARNNVVLRPDDRIYIPPAVGSEQRIIVLGQVTRPGVVHYSKSITFLEAIAECGGAKPSAWERRSFVVRGRLSSPTIIPVNARAVMTGAARDIELQPGDIVLVPIHAIGKIEEVTSQILPLLNSLSTSENIAD